MKVILAVKESESKSSIGRLHWNFDVEKTKIAIKAQKCFKKNLESLTEVSMLSSLQSKKLRDNMRKYYDDDKNKKLLLTEKDIEAESDESDSCESDGELEVEVSSDSE